MKKNSASHSAFFSLRLLAALLVGMTGVSLAVLAGSPFLRGAKLSAASNGKMQQKYAVSTQGQSISPLVPPGFDCAQIRSKGIEKMENLRAGAIMIFCGEARGGGEPEEGGGSNAFSRLVRKVTAPVSYGGMDVDLITGTETFPNITQSETFSTANPDDPTQVLVAYNDSRGRNFAPINISGASFSTDGGLTFTRLTKANGQSPFDNTFGDPVALYNKSNQTWYTIWLDGGCGGQGLGGYKSTTPGDPNSWTHFCAHVGSFDDRESGWVDNNPASPFFGRMYVSWNDFNTFCGAGGCLFETFSSDGGATWSAPVQVQTGTSLFIRDVQITGDVAGGGAVYIAGMDEGGGGFPHNDTNYLYKSTDGGVTWTNTYVGTAFPGPGVTAVGYFACMFNDLGGYWRHEGWGEPAAINNFVHLVYAQHGTGSDPGDVYYIRSTDGGFTFGAPVKLNTDATTRPQWQPNISVSPSGTLLATWYDARESASCSVGNPAVPCYRMWARKSNDNGVTWLPDDTLSDVVSPLPAQPDPGIVSIYVGDYDYGSAITVKHLTSWVDGRVTINGQSQQDAFTDRELVGFSVTNTDPQCGSFVVGTAPTVFTVNLSDAVNENTVQPTDFTVNGTPADSVAFSNGDLTLTFSFNSSPAVSGSNTMHIPANAFTRQSDNQGNLEFQCTFRYGQEQLAVTDTVPPVGGTFTPPAPGTYTYDVNWNHPVDPTSVQTSDLQLSGNTGATVTNVTVINGNQTTEFTLNIPFGGPLTADIAAGAIADSDGNPNAAFNGSYTVEGCPPSQYTVTSGTDTIVPGTTDIGSHCDDCDTPVTLPFAFTLYDQTFTSVNVSSNGRLDFVVANEPGGFITSCLPAPPNVGPYDFTIFGAWEDMRTDSNSGCSSFPGGNCGVFTTVEGTAPNRIFDIEWRSVLFGNTSSAVNFEVRLFENDPNLKFEIVYGNINTGGATESWVGGVQGNSGAGFFTQDFCGANPPTNVSKTYQIPPCASPTPTPTPTITPTPTATPTPTPTPTPRLTPTPRPRGTPRPRPTP
jgi:hypothetical protein